MPLLPPPLPQIVAETPKHFLRMLPLVLNPLPPPFGFVLIFVSSLLPRVISARNG